MTDGCSVPTARNGSIEIDLGNRERIRVDAHVDPEALARSSTCLSADDRHTRNVRVWLATGHIDMRRQAAGRLVEPLELSIEDLDET
jgi:hypothetical protein